MQLEWNASNTGTDLVQMLVDETTDSKTLPLSPMEDITRGFSKDRETGNSGFVVVYKVVCMAQVFQY